MWVIYTIAGLAGLIVLVLCVPIDLTFNLDTSRSEKFRIKLVWLFGLIGKQIKREKGKPKKKALKEKLPEKKRGKKRKREFKTILKILRTKGLLRIIKKLVRDILSQFKIRELAVNVKLGLDNPADMGFVYALIGVTKPFLNLPPQYQIRVQPYFLEELSLEGYLNGLLRLQPIGLIIPITRFIFSRAALRVAIILVLSKWKRKK